MTQTTNKNLSRNRRLALAGAFSALEIVLTFTNLGFISFNPVVSITILHIPVILVAILGGLPEGIFVGFIMGLLSLIKAAMSPTSILDPFFVYPWNSILPRMLLGAAAWGLWKLIGLIPHLPKVINAGISAFVATVLHTLMVFGCIFLFNGRAIAETLASNGMAGAGYWTVVCSGIVTEFLEAVASTVVCVAVFGGLAIAGTRKSKLSKETEE